jgi:hypothetical protein
LFFYPHALEKSLINLSGSAGSDIQFSDATINTVSAPYLFTFSISADFGIPFVGNSLPSTQLMTSDAGDVVGTYPGFTTVDPGQTFGLAFVSYTVSSSAVLGTSDQILFDLTNGATSLADNSNPSNSIPFMVVNGTINVVPEPSALILISVGLAVISFSRSSAVCLRR